MTILNNGGPAFPHSDSVLYQQGMSLRDYFAGQALEGILAEFFHHENEAQSAAIRAYAMADAMLAERAKGGAS